MILNIDGKDYSHLVPRRGYQVSYRKILGANSAYTLDGTYHEDVLAFKAIINIELMPMASTQLSELVESVQSCERATYFDTRTNENVTNNVIATLNPARLVLNRTNKMIWNDSADSGIVLVLEQR